MKSFGHEKEPAVQSAIIPLWEKQARQWARVRPPLRPSAPDLVFAQDEIDRQAALIGQLNAVILGVTPELLDLRWPASARVLAVDLSGSMIRGLWRANLNHRHCRWSVQGDWLHLPIRRGRVDLVLGDGCFGFFSTGRENFIESVHSALKPGGTWLVRVFMRPDIGESPEQVWEELMARRIGNFHIFK